jgi:hypothetical protein
MNVLETCLIGTDHRRRRSYSLGTLSSMTNEMLLLTPRPPPDKQLLYSTSESISGINTDTSSDGIPSNRSSYKFHCKNVSPNLHIIVKTDVDHIESHRETCMEADDDVMDRIIPEYYINHTGIKTGALTFDYYETILDSIRNLRTLNRHQIQFLKTITHDQLIQIVHTYNDMFGTYMKWLICDEFPTTCNDIDKDLNTNPYA